MSSIVSGGALRSIGRVCPLNERIEGGGEGAAAGTPGSRHQPRNIRRKTKLACVCKDRLRRHGSSRKTPHRAGIWVLGGRAAGGLDARPEWKVWGERKKTTTTTTTVGKDGVALNGDNKAALRDKWSARYRGLTVRKERKKQPRVAPSGFSLDTPRRPFCRQRFRAKFKLGKKQ